MQNNVGRKIKKMHANTHIQAQHTSDDWSAAPCWPIRQMDGVPEQMWSVVRCIKGVIMTGSSAQAARGPRTVSMKQ